MDKLRSRLKLMLGRKFGLNWLKMTTMDDRTSDFFCFNYNDGNYKWWCLFLVNPTILFMCPSFVHMKVELWCSMLDIFPKKKLVFRPWMVRKSRLHGYKIKVAWVREKRGWTHIWYAFDMYKPTKYVQSRIWNVFNKIMPKFMVGQWIKGKSLVFSISIRLDRLVLSPRKKSIDRGCC